MEADVLYEDAVASVLTRRDRSCASLQRYLGISYSRASKLLGRMAQNGVLVGIGGDTQDDRLLIKVVGVGGAGGNALEGLNRLALPCVETIAVNSDADGLGRSTAHRKIQLGRPGNGGNLHPDMSSELAWQSQREVSEALRGAHLVFIVAGMGGGTGAGAAPVVAQIAQKQGAMRLGVAFTPWPWEIGPCQEIAKSAVAALGSHVDSLFSFSAGDLEDESDASSLLDLLRTCDLMVHEAVELFANLFSSKACVSVSLSDLKAVMKSGRAWIGSGRASGAGAADVAVAMACAALSKRGVGGREACGLLAVVTSGDDKGPTSGAVMKAVSALLAPEASIVIGHVLDDTMHDEIRIALIATCI